MTVQTQGRVGTMVAGNISRFERIGQLIKSWGQEREGPGIRSLLPSSTPSSGQGLDGEGVGNRRVPGRGRRWPEGKQPRSPDPAAPAPRAR